MTDAKKEEAADYYEVLQVSFNAEQETINRVYRLFAQRFHPDNAETGDEARFRLVTEAYTTLSNPEQRAKYDVGYQRQRQLRWRLVAAGSREDNNFQHEHQIRMTILGVLYANRWLEPDSRGLFDLDLEGLTGQAREHLRFTIWYLTEKGLVARGDTSRLNITAQGVDYLEAFNMSMSQGNSPTP